MSQILNEQLSQVSADVEQLRARVHQRIVGQDAVIDGLINCLIAGGHGLFVGVPGLAKTLLVSTVAEATGLSFSRLQFTPDLMPADILGSEVLEEDRASGTRSFRFIKGPVFAQLVLADEINRTPPKTQAALLQAMQEGRVSVAGKDHDLGRPFHVFATQNPIEQEGTYPLPEAQLDRFLMQLEVHYPSAEEERKIAALSDADLSAPIAPVWSAERLLAIQAMVEEIAVDESVIDAAVALVRRSRPASDAPDLVQQYLRWGAGPRASRFLVRAARARALMAGRPAADLSDLRALAPAVLGHRLIPNFKAESEGLTGAILAQRLIA
jgi:MoxR-like ATPase